MVGTVGKNVKIKKKKARHYSILSHSDLYRKVKKALYSICTNLTSF